MEPIRFVLGPHGHMYGVAEDGTEIVKCFSGHQTCTYYKKSRPDIDDQRVRMRYEELRKYNLHKTENKIKPYSLDKRDDIHWGEEVRQLVGYDKEGFPLYEWANEEILGPGVNDGRGKTKGLRAFQIINGGMRNPLDN